MTITASELRTIASTAYTQEEIALRYQNVLPLLESRAAQKGFAQAFTIPAKDRTQFTAYLVAQGFLVVGGQFASRGSYQILPQEQTEPAVTVTVSWQTFQLTAPSQNINTPGTLTLTLTTQGVVGESVVVAIDGVGLDPLWFSGDLEQTVPVTAGTQNIIVTATNSMPPGTQFRVRVYPDLELEDILADSGVITAL
jgi:hypothetical protein